VNEQHDSLTATILTIAEHLERSIDTHGWDQPATLWEISMTEQNVPQHVLDEIEHGGGVAVGFEATFIDALEGHPYAALVGRTISDDAVGIALSSEGWNYSEASQAMAQLGPLSYPPSEDPDRKEIRIVSVMLRDGTTAALVRERGQDTQLAHDRGAPGRVEAAMRRYLHLPSGLDNTELAAHVIPRAFTQAVLAFLVRAASNEHALDVLRSTLDQHLADNDNSQDEARAALNNPAALRALAVNAAWYSLMDMPLTVLTDNAPDELAELLNLLPGDTVTATLDHILDSQYSYPTWDELAEQVGRDHAGWFDAGLLENHIVSSVANSNNVNDLIDAVEEFGLVAAAADVLRVVSTGR
jgi:hypothetical protein